MSDRRTRPMITVAVFAAATAVAAHPALSQQDSLLGHCRAKAETAFSGSFEEFWRVYDDCRSAQVVTSDGLERPAVSLGSAPITGPSEPGPSVKIELPTWLYFELVDAAREAGTLPEGVQSHLDVLAIEQPQLEFETETIWSDDVIAPDLLLDRQGGNGDMMDLMSPGQ